MAIGLEHYLVVGAVLFALGLVCCMARRTAIGILIGIELILNAANINLIAFDRFGTGRFDGQIFAVFVIILAACEAAIALAIIIGMFMNFGTIDTDVADKLEG
ncbi:MAG: NADH-quinone oxidoreductase subunit NuoK [Candidatus Sumerlaeota bacterium]|nr:NADH-quinone oxidoreductase subunit NuoK [Candidatus Sumerlaeota bacterium]